MIRPAQHVLLGQGRAGEPAADAQFIGMGDVSSSDGTIALSVPEGTEPGDLLLAVVVTRNDRAITAPSGWTQVSAPVASSISVGVYQKAYAGTESLDFMVAPAGAAYGFISSYKGSFAGWADTTTGGSVRVYTPEYPNSVIGSFLFGVGPYADPISVSVGGLDNMTMPAVSAGGFLSGSDYYYIAVFGYTNTADTELVEGAVRSEVDIGGLINGRGMFEIAPPGA